MYNVCFNHLTFGYEGKLVDCDKKQGTSIRESNLCIAIAGLQMTAASRFGHGRKYFLFFK